MVESSRNILIPGDSENPLPPQHWTSHQVWWEKGNIGRFGFCFFFLTLWSHVGLGAGSTLGESSVFSYELDVPLVGWQLLLGHEKRRNNPGKRWTELQAVWSQGSQVLLPSKHFRPIYFFSPILRYDWQIKIVYNQAVLVLFFLKRCAKWWLNTHVHRETSMTIKLINIPITTQRHLSLLVVRTFFYSGGQFQVHVFSCFLGWKSR